MRAEDTLQFMMDFQGDVFCSRQSCLNHLFCVVGNGYDWVNGELVENSYDTKLLLSRWKLVKPIERAEPTETTQMIYKPTMWSTLSKEYSKLYNYPQDIKPDWLEILEECKQMLIADDIEV